MEELYPYGRSEEVIPEKEESSDDYKIRLLEKILCRYPDYDKVSEILKLTDNKKNILLPKLDREMNIYFKENNDTYHFMSEEEFQKIIIDSGFEKIGGYMLSNANKTFAKHFWLNPNNSLLLSSTSYNFLINRLVLDYETIFPNKPLEMALDNIASQDEIKKFTNGFVIKQDVTKGLVNKLNVLEKQGNIFLSPWNYYNSHEIDSLEYSLSDSVNDKYKKPLGLLD